MDGPLSLACLIQGLVDSSYSGPFFRKKCDDLEKNPMETLPFPLGTKVSCENDLNTNPITDGLFTIWLFNIAMENHHTINR